MYSMRVKGGSMKICIIAPTVIPVLGRNQKYGGIELVVALATEELVKRGHEVFLFASGDSKTSAKLVATVEEAIGQGSSLDQEKEANLKAYQMAVAEKPDVIWDNTLALHAHEMRQNLSQFLYKADIYLNPNVLVATGDIPIIQTLHGPAKDHCAVIVESLTHLGHYCVSISHDQAKRYVPYVKKGQHLGTVYNAVDTDFYHIEPNKTGNYLLWLGRFCAEKGAHIALEVANEVKMPIKLVGKISEKHEQNYFDVFIKPILGPKDEVLGQVSHEEKAKLYSNAYATLMTNLWPEPFGLVAAESMAAGTPVVGPALGSLSEVIGGNGILVPVDDLHLDENESYFSDNQKKYAKRVAEYIPKVKNIPPELARDRAEKIFCVAHNVDGYEASFAKAVYLEKRKLKALEV